MNHHNIMGAENWDTLSYLMPEPEGLQENLIMIAIQGVYPIVLFPTMVFTGYITDIADD